MGCCATAQMPEEVLPGDPLRASSIFYLQTDFCREVKSIGKTLHCPIYELDEPLIRAKGAKQICPRDWREGAAFVDTLSGIDHVGRASHMLSYTWGYTVDCISASLSAWCHQHEHQPARTYVWTCFMGINQHRVQESRALGVSVPFDDFATEFGSRIAQIGHVIALMEPWRAPKYCRRAWCVFELHTALEAGKLDIVMPPAEVLGFAKAVYDGVGLQEQWRTLSETKLQQAEASVPLDRDNIFSMVERGCGFTQLNSNVVLQLQKWFADVAYNHVKDRMSQKPSADIVHGCLRVAELFRSLGRLDRADSLLVSALEILGKVDHLHTPLHASVLSSMGHVKRERGDLEGALALLLDGHAILQRGSLTCEEGALLLTRLGHVKLQQQDLEAADCYFREALQAHESCQSLWSFDGAQLLQSLGHVQRERKDFKGAFSSYGQAQEVLRGCELLESPAGAALVASMGHLQREQGNLEGAMGMYVESRRLLESTGSLQTSNGAALLVNIGHVQRSLGDPDAALVTYKEARDLFKASASWDSPAGVECRRLIGMLSA